MDRYHKEACESVDACIFSGDLLYDSLEELKEYLRRWNLAVEEHARQMLEEQAEQVSLNKCPCGAEISPPSDGSSPICAACGMMLVRGKSGRWTRSIFDDVDE